jgi:olefin beta-lactone synthetase
MNIALRIAEVSRQFPHKRSVVFAQRRGHTYDYPFYTFREFEERSNQMANRLFKYGIGPGTRTLLFVKPCLDFSVITFALFKLGALPVLIDPGMGVKNLLASIRQVRPEALISIGAVHWLRRIRRKSFKTVKIKVSLDPVGGATHHLLDKLFQEDTHYHPVERKPEDEAAILFTSGGTGVPKGVIYTHGILNAQTDLLQRMFSLNETHVDLPGFPLFALFTLAMGMTSVIPDMDPRRPAQCDPRKIVQNILEQGTSFVAGSPAIWERVARFCVEKNIQLGPVRQVVMFGAPVHWEIHQMYRRILPFGDTYTPYGATECLPVTLISGSEILKRHLPQTLQGQGTCIGRAVHQTQVKVIQISDIPEHELKELPVGQVGEFCVRGPQVTPAYFEMDDETRKAKIHVGDELWHRMGDVGQIDADGNLWFLGRKSHRVEIEGHEYYPLQIEAIFNQHPEVRRSALIKPSRDEKTILALAIERRDGKTQVSEAFIRELQSLALKTALAAKVEAIFLHPSFPTDVRHNIKIDRPKLSQWASKQGRYICLSDRGKKSPG